MSQLKNSSKDNKNDYGHLTISDQNFLFLLLGMGID